MSVDPHTILPDTLEPFSDGHRVAHEVLHARHNELQGIEDGGPGQPGASAYQIAVQNGFVGTEQEWLDSLKGSSGTNPQSYRHSQTVSSAVWTVVHNLGYRPGGIYVEDTAHTQWHPHVHHIDNNSLTLSFFVGGIPAPMTGEADLS